MYKYGRDELVQGILADQSERITVAELQKNRK